MFVDASSWRKNAVPAPLWNDSPWQQFYAKATDIIGTNTKAGIEEGRAIYHRIFTPEAMIRAGGSGSEQLVRQGPDGWQMYDMTLTQVAGELRELGDA